MKKKQRNLLVILAVVVVVVVIVLLNLRLGSSGELVETALVRYGSIVSRVTADGSLEAENQVNVSGEVMGRIDRLLVKEGDNVVRGQILCELDPTNYKANLDLVRARFELAQQAFERSSKLHEQKLISQEEFERARTEYQVAQATFSQASDNFRKTKIVAPISGKIVKLNIHEGEAVIIGTMNNPGTVMMTLADLSEMKATVKVDEADIAQVRPGQEVKVTLDAVPDSSFPGKVTRVGYMPITGSVLTQQQGGTDFQVEIALTRTSPALRPGMTASADIITAQKDSVLIVPIQAVGRRKVKDRETDAVFRFERGKAVLTPVQPGVSSETEIEIRSGLEDGEPIIVGPYRILSRLKDGAQVKSSQPALKGRHGERGHSRGATDVRRPLRVIRRIGS